jgi:serine protease Do
MKLIYQPAKLSHRMSLFDMLALGRRATSARGKLPSGDMSGGKMRHPIFVVALLLASTPASARTPTSDVILDQANHYTVKIRRVASIGLSEDEGTSASATGFLVDRTRGWILTNAHVASRSPATITVSFKGHKYVPARRVFVDRLTDVAVLEIDKGAIPADAVTADLECIQPPRVGNPVAIFGHPGDLSYTATRGIISSVSWVFPTEIIQSDATINGGNSGGPLIDLSTGKIVGIAAASYRDTDDDHSTAVSFSEPIRPVCQILDLLKAGRDARYRQLPAAYATAEDDDRPIVATVFDQASGLKIGDRVVGINGRKDIRNSSDLANRLRGADGLVDVIVDREGVEVTLKAATFVMPEVTDNRSIEFSGLVISNQWKLDSAEFQHEGYPVIDFVLPGSPAEMTKAYPSYHLVAINNRTITDLEKLYEFLSSLPAEDEVSLVLKATTSADQFYRQYHLVTLPRGKPRWLKASQSADD